MQEPMCRVTIRDDVLTLNRWRPGLLDVVEPPPGVALADVTLLSPGELLVEWVAGGSAPEALLAWAELVGYSRVWLPDQVVDFPDSLVPVGEAEVECPTCGITWTDCSPDFWAGVRRYRYFPGSCLACNGSLPEWQLPVRFASEEATHR
jgi:hypothetical protein